MRSVTSALMVAAALAQACVPGSAPLGRGDPPAAGSATVPLPELLDGSAAGRACDGGGCSEEHGRGGPAASGSAAGSGPGPAPTVADRTPGGRFPPADFEPPSARSAKAGDGTWRRLGDASTGDRAADGRAVLYITTVHPHPVSRFDSVTLAAIDLRHTAVHFMPGKDDPGTKDLDPPAGHVPEPDRAELLVVFNGGYLPRHGRWGMMVQGRELVPPRDDGCTIGLYRDGRVRIRPWTELESSTGEMEAYRQTPPCLLDGGKLHPTLDAGNERPWGGRDPNRKTRRRSALGIDSSRRVLLYGMGTEVGAQLLAQAMKHAGAVDAVQLDINWSWTRFLLYGQPRPGGALQVTSTLIPKTTHSSKGYLERAGHRDFFYVLRRGP